MNCASRMTKTALGILGCVLATIPLAACGADAEPPEDVATSEEALTCGRYSKKFHEGTAYCNGCGAQPVCNATQSRQTGFTYCATHGHQYCYELELRQGYLTGWPEVEFVATSGWSSKINCLWAFSCPY